MDGIQFQAGQVNALSRRFPICLRQRRHGGPVRDDDHHDHHYYPFARGMRLTV
jgi:hypothetical protein